MKLPVQRVRNPADYGYSSPDIVALSARALEVTRRTTEAYGESRFSTKSPISMLVDILLSHRTRDEQTAAGYDNLLKRFGSWEGVRDAPVNEVKKRVNVQHKDSTSAYTNSDEINVQGIGPSSTSSMHL